MATGNNGKRHGHDSGSTKDEKPEPSSTALGGRWRTGEAAIEGMIRDRTLEQVSPNTFHAHGLLEQANLDLDTARQLTSSNPTRAYEALYESYRQAINGLLAKQGLAVTREGGHVAYGDALLHQTSNEEIAELFHEMRMRRNELQYPTETTMTVHPDEVTEHIKPVGHAVGLVIQLAESDRIGPF